MDISHMTRGVVTDDSVASGGLTELEINSLEVIVSLGLEEEEISGVKDVTSTGDTDEVDEVEVTFSPVVKLALATEVGGSAIL